VDSPHERRTIVIDELNIEPRNAIARIS